LKTTHTSGRIEEKKKAFNKVREIHCKERTKWPRRMTAIFITTHPVTRGISAHSDMSQPPLGMNRSVTSGKKEDASENCVHFATWTSRLVDFVLLFCPQLPPSKAKGPKIGHEVRQQIFATKILAEQTSVSIVGLLLKKHCSEICVNQFHRTMVVLQPTHVCKCLPFYSDQKSCQQCNMHIEIACLMTCK
jgi:hypothetical protein